MADIPIIYLDSNVVIDMYKGLLPDLRSEVLKASESLHAIFPFSADTVSEIALKIHSKEEIMQRLLFLTVISQDLYFEKSAFDFQFIGRDAFQVYDTLSAVTTGLNAEAYFRTFVSYDTHKSTSTAYGMDPKVMNNLPPEPLFEYINQKLSEYEYSPGSNDPGPRNVEQFLDLTESFWRKHNESFWNNHQLDPEKMMRGLRHATLFNLLDSFGYCRDKKGEYDKGSAFADSSHTFLASHCTFLASSDSRMRNRAKAVFWYFGHGTQVVSPEELMKVLKAR